MIKKRVAQFLCPHGKRLVHESEHSETHLFFHVGTNTKCTPKGGADKLYCLAGHRGVIERLEKENEQLRKLVAQLEKGAAKSAATRDLLRGAPLGGGLGKQTT